MSSHHLGTYHDEFEAIFAGFKKWERLPNVRRLFVKGDEIYLREVDCRSNVVPDPERHKQHRLTGRVLRLTVTHVDYDRPDSSKVHFRCLGPWTPADEKEQEDACASSDAPEEDA